MPSQIISGDSLLTFLYHLILHPTLHSRDLKVTSYLDGDARALIENSTQMTAITLGVAATPALVSCWHFSRVGRIWRMYSPSANLSTTHILRNT